MTSSTAAIATVGQRLVIEPRPEPRRYAFMAAVDLDHADSILLNPVTMGLFEQMIMTRLLLSHPHSYTEALRRHERPIGPRDIKRAVDYLEPISMRR